MASKVLTSSVGPRAMVSNKASSGPILVGLGPRSVLFPSSLKTAPLVVRAQPLEGRSSNVDSPNQIRARVTPFHTSPFVHAPWSTAEDEHEIRMWFDMPGLTEKDIDVNIVGDMLFVKGEASYDPFGRKIGSPYEAKFLQLPIDCVKEEIMAVLKNGVLYISVPKVPKVQETTIHVPVKPAY